jgi:adenylylsulfate reductase subunit B
MSIEILKDSCIGCGRCSKVCPGSLIRIKDGKAFMKYPENCWGCASCLKECQAGALRLYLGKDMGGLGGKLSVTREGALLHWTVEKPDGSCQTITIDSRNSNQY